MLAVLLGALAFAGAAQADPLVYQMTGADLAFAKYGLTGKGVAVAIIDRGIQWQNADFINPDGTTRIKYMLDMSGQHGCVGNPPINGANGPTVGTPAPVEYTAAQINAALAGTGPAIPERDALGHGTATMGMTAGNGRSFANGKYIGIAPQADLIIVRGVVEAVPAHGTEAAQAAFFGCMTQAFQWLDQKITALGEPVVGMINSESTAGPHDGTATVSRLIDQYFSNRPGRAFVLPSGDEGLYADHAGGAFNGSQATVVNFTRTSAGETPIGIWYSGSAKAKITVSFSDGTTVGPLGPVTAPFNNILNSADGTVSLSQWFPGSEFDQVNSTSGDHFASIDITGHATAGTIAIQGVTGTDSGTFNMYSDLNGYTIFTSNTVPGHINDWATTRSASVTGAYVLRTNWVDIDGISRSSTNQGAIGALWTGSNDGPTRDGRLGISVVAPGQNTWTSYATNSFWATTRGVLVQDGGGFYGQAGAVSGATPIIAGAVALMLQKNPGLTSEQARNFLQQSATTDGFTGPVPNPVWGYGKLNILGALDLMTQVAQCSYTLSAGAQAFTSQGGSGTIQVMAPAGCPWSVTGLPTGVTLTSPSSGSGNGTVTFQVVAAAAGGSSSFNVAGVTFTIDQQAASIPGLVPAGSLAEVVSEGGWSFELDAVNLGSSAATARVNFADGTGNPLQLPLTFPQKSTTALPELAASLDRSINPNARIVIDSNGPGANQLLASGQLLSNGSISGFGIFSFSAFNWNAVVPLETRKGSTYSLPFDNTGVLTTGVALANITASTISVQVTILSDSGAKIGTDTITLPAQGSQLFTLPSRYSQTTRVRGTVQFTTTSPGQLSVLGVRANALAALTTLPVLSNLDLPGGSISDLTYGGGFTSTFYLVNTGTSPAPFTLSFYNQSGTPANVPLFLPQTGATQTTTSLTQTLAAGQMLEVATQAGTSTNVSGSAQLTATGGVSGFEIFDYAPNGQEASVPLETRTPNNFVLVYDNTNGLTTGVALANASAAAANIVATIYDDQGNVLQTTTIPMAAHAQQTIILNAVYPNTAGKRGMVKFAVPSSGPISMIGIRVGTIGATTTTTIPILTK